MQIRKVLLCLALVAPHIEAASVFGASLYVSHLDDDVVAEFRGDSSSLLRNQLFMDAPTPAGPFFDNKSSSIGATASLGTYPGGTLLVLRDQVTLDGSPEYGTHQYYTGPGSDNPDGRPHALITYDPTDPAGVVRVGFEDLEGTSADNDFNDFVIDLTNVTVGFTPSAFTGNSNSTSYNHASGATGAFGDPGTSFDNSGQITNDGYLYNYGNLALSGSGTLENTGTVFSDLGSTIDIGADAEFSNDGTLVAFGGITIEGSFTNTTQGILPLLGTIGAIGGATGSIVTAAAGSRVQNDGTIENNTQIINEGGEAIINGVVTGLGIYTQTSGSTVNNGTLGGSSVQIQGGTLSGNGTVTAPTTVGPQGTLSPGESPGVLSFGSDLTVDGGSVIIEIDSTSVFDQLIVSGHVILGGNVNFYFSFTPQVGGRFTWLTAGGGIDESTLPTYSIFGADGMQFLHLQEGDSFVLEATAAVPAPAAGWLLLTGLGMTGLMRWRSSR